MSMWKQLKDWASILMRDVHAVYLASRDHRVPWFVKVFAIFIVGYALSPIDLIPDFIPILGYVDELILLPLALKLVIYMIPPAIMAEHRALAAAAQEPPVSRTAAFIIAGIWGASFALCAWLAYRHFFKT